MSCEFRSASSRARRAVSRGRQSGFTLVELLVVISIIGMLMALLLPQLASVRESGRQNTCRNNMRALATALMTYNGRFQNYPGYMNALQTANGNVFKDPINFNITPVSWAVMILPDIDRVPLYNDWTKDWGSAGGGSGSGGGGGSGGGFVSTRFYTDQYIELFVCPSDPPSSRTGTPISYVVNSGQQDVPSSTPATTTSGGKGIPRDWASSGVFFDRFSDDVAVKTTTNNRGPMEVMRDERIRDPKDKTILLTENVDAENYVFNSVTSGTTWLNTEIEAGCNWSAGTVSIAVQPPQMTPIYSAGSGGGGGSGGSSGSSTGDSDTLRINNSAGKSDGSYAYCRPSSKHPQMVNVAFVGQNVAPMRDSISYFIFAKLMASDDEGLKVPGSTNSIDTVTGNSALREYQMTEAEINP